MATHDMFYGTLAASGTTDVRPPAGEVWQIGMYEQGSLADPDLVSVNAGGNVGSITFDAYDMGGTPWIDNATWVRLSNAAAANRNYAVSVIKHALTDVPVRVLSVALAVNGVYEMRPPVGTDWMLKSIHGTAWLSVKNALVESATLPIRSNYHVASRSAKYGAKTSAFLTNALWGKISTASGAGGNATVVYAELPSGSLVQQTGLQGVASGGFVDIRPPAGVIWVIGAWFYASTGLLVAYDGTTQTTLDDSWPHLNARFPVGNAKWLRLSAGTTVANFGWVGWTYPA